MLYRYSVERGASQVWVAVWEHLDEGGEGRHNLSGCHRLGGEWVDIVKGCTSCEHLIFRCNVLEHGCMSNLLRVSIMGCDWHGIVASGSGLNFVSCPCLPGVEWGPALGMLMDKVQVMPGWYNEIDLVVTVIYVEMGSVIDVVKLARFGNFLIVIDYGHLEAALVAH